MLHDVTGAFCILRGTLLEKYSVLMSVYYKEKPEYLKASIDSMLHQSVQPDQFVLVKDGLLTAELDEVIDEYVKENRELFAIVELPENRGLGIALDEGMKYCRNDLVARMDSDDISISDRCEKQLKVFEQTPELSIVSGNIGEFVNDPKNLVSIRNVPERHEAIKKRMRTRSAFNHPAVMYRKTDVVRCGGYGTLRRKQDHVLFSHMLCSGCRAYNIQDIILLFRADSDSLKRKKSWDNCKSYIAAEWSIFMRHECGLGDLLYVILAQLFFYCFPDKAVDFITKRYLRERVQ